jgi:hypothetical protein
MRALLIATAVAAMLTSNAAVAQQSNQPMMGQQMPMMGQGWMGNNIVGHGMMPMMDPSQHIEGRLAFLKTELKITDAQTPQWNAYADALRANAKRMSELMNEMMSSGMMGQGMMMGNQGMMMQGQPGTMMQGQPGTMMSLPDRLNWAEQHMAAHMEMLQAIKGPADQLYGVLSDEQKRVADQILGPMGMMGMM